MYRQDLDLQCSSLASDEHDFIIRFFFLRASPAKETEPCCCCCCVPIILPLLYITLLYSYEKLISYVFFLCSYVHTVCVLQQQSLCEFFTLLLYRSFYPSTIPVRILLLLLLQSIAAVSIEYRCCDIAAILCEGQQPDEETITDNNGPCMNV